MPKDNLSLYALAKYTYKELLLEEYIQSKGLFKSKFIERYRRKEKLIKIKIIIVKVLYSIIFGILPILPVLAYLEIVDYLREIPLSAENILLTGSLFFGLYFVLQFFNFILMGLLESGTLMSGDIFDWFETLPISRDKLHKLAYLTIFRSFDIPLITTFLGFPIIMLIGTEFNIWIFFLCLGISFLNTILSFNLLILFGEKLSRILGSHQAHSRKHTMIRMITIISYLVIILGSVYTVQWALNSLELLFRWVVYYRYTSITILILSLIPYPFNPSFLIAFNVDPSVVALEHWITVFLGLGLLILLTLWTYLKVKHILNRITFLEHKNLNKNSLIKSEIKIKKHSQVGAFLLKDLSIATHDLKIFMTMIMPIILSCVFSFSFNFYIISGPVYLERDIAFNWIGLMIFMPIITTMLVYGIMDIDLSGESILASLPIDRRSQAKAKLIILLVLQTLAVILPSLIYITNSKFLILFLTSLISLPLIYIILILTFEMKILHFGRKKLDTNGKQKYVINDINPENKLVKWGYIVCVQYIISFWLISLVFIFFIFQIFLFFLWIYVLAIFIGFASVLTLFNKMFPITEIQRYKKFSKSSQYKRRYIGKWDIEKISYESRRYYEGKPTIFTHYPQISIIISFLLLFLTVIWSQNLLSPFQYQNSLENSILTILIYNLIFMVLIFFIIPKIIGIPFGRMPLKKYLNSIKAGRPNSLFKSLLWGIVGVFALFIFNSMVISFYYSTMYTYLYRMENDIYKWILIASQIVWNELFFRGILLTTLQKNKGKYWALFLNTIISSLFPLVLLYLFEPFDYINMSDFNLYVILIFQMNLILGYLSIRADNILPGILALLILNTIVFSISTYYWVFI